MLTKEVLQKREASNKPAPIYHAPSNKCVKIITAMLYLVLKAKINVTNLSFLIKLFKVTHSKILSLENSFFLDSNNYLM